VIALGVFAIPKLQVPLLRAGLDFSDWASAKLSFGPFFCGALKHADLMAQSQDLELEANREPQTHSDPEPEILKERFPQQSQRRAAVNIAPRFGCVEFGAEPSPNNVH
jgi:hypothetical protein